MPANWPDSLPAPRDVLVDGYSETWGGSIIRTDMEAGPAKLRRRTTAVARPLACRMMLEPEQVSTLRSFFVSTLSDGVLPFSFELPRTGTDILVRFASEITVSPVGSGELFAASFTLEWLP